MDLSTDDADTILMTDIEDDASDSPGRRRLQPGFEPSAVYEALGRTLAESHALELALVRLYAVSEFRTLWPQTLHSLLAEREKWRIANRLQQVVLDLGLEMREAQRLALALQYRRYLTNDFAFEFEKIAFDPSIHPAAIQRLAAIEAILSEQVVELNELFIERQSRRQDSGLKVQVEEAIDYYRGKRDSFDD